MSVLSEAQFHDEAAAYAWVEARACGTPIVICVAGGAREVGTSASAGRIVARDLDAIAAAVHELLAAPPAQVEVAASAARFSWGRNAERLTEIWREALLA